MARVPGQLSRLAKIVGGTRGVDEYVLGHTSGRRAISSGGRTTGIQSSEYRRIEVTVHRDLRRGRGTATFTLPADPQAAATYLTRQAAVRAARARGPSWSLPPPSAPARVNIADPLIAEDTDKTSADLIAELTQLVASGPIAKLAGKPLVVSSVRAEASAETVAVVTSRGFARAFDRTDMALEATLTMEGAGPAAVEAIRRRSRKRDGLGLEQAVTAAAQRMIARTRAKPLGSGRYDLVLMDDALTREFRALPYGWLSCIVAQTSASLERQGLTRYKPGQSIFGAAKSAGDPITITSDGTRPFGDQSRPFGSASEPVRRWPVVRDGVAVGLSLDLREAALRGTSPNGGVRNLVVDGGPTAVADLIQPAAARPLLRAVELAWLEVDARTGQFTAELGLGYLSGAGKKNVPVYGGALRGDVFSLLSRARLSSDTTTRGWYSGPRALRVANMQID